MQLEDYFDFEKFEGRELIRLKGTRLVIEVLLEDFKKGAAPAEIQENFPSATLEQVYATITYYLHNQESMDAYLRRSREIAEAAYQEWKRTHKPSQLEQKLKEVREASLKDRQASA